MPDTDSSPPPIAVIGNANLDIVGGPLTDWPEHGTETFLDRSDLRLGGSAANTALVLQRLGARSGLISAAGTDLVGQMIESAFAGPLDRITRIAGPSSVTFGVLHPGAERTFFSTRGHLDRLEVAHLLAPLDGWPLDGALALVSGSFAVPALEAATSDILQRFRDQGAATAIDPGWPGGNWTEPERSNMRRWIGLSDHVLLNDKELIALTGQTDVDAAAAQAAPFLSPGGQLIVKCGADGARSFAADGTRHSATAPKADIFDTIGAGDAFNAGYLAALQSGLTGADALAQGCRIATAVIADFPRGTARWSNGTSPP